MNLKLFSFLITILCLVSCASSKDFSIRDGDFEVKLTEYHHKNSDKSQQIVFIIPPTGGTNLIDRSYARKISRAGIKAVIINDWTHTSRRTIELKYHNDFYRNAQKAIDLAFNHYPKMKHSLLGTSIGAMHSAITLGRYKNLKSAFLIVGGGNIAKIIANSDQDAMVGLKTKRFEKFKYSGIDEYIAALKKILPYEPLHFEKYSDQKIAMVISTIDKTVPFENQQTLATHLKPEVLIKSHYSHKSTVIKTWLCDADEIVNFFLKE